MTTMTAAPAGRTLLGRLEAAWRRSDEVFALLDDAAWYTRPIALRQPFIFYVGHLPAFAWNQVVRGLLGREGFRPEFDELFARGIDPVGIDRYEPDAPTLWPRPADVLAYRDRVREGLRDSVADVGALEGSDVLAERGRVYNLVIEHELMHQETLLYMMQQLPFASKRRPARLPPYVLDGAAAPSLVRVPRGPVSLGADFERVEFGWDNEFPQHTVEVEAFGIDATPVRNGEFLEFLTAGGYANQALWDADAWAWKARVDLAHPATWVPTSDGWRYRTMFDELPLDRVRDWPVYVSYAEALAYARWQGADLPTEAEWQRAALGAPWGDTGAANIGLTHWAPTPVGHYAAGASRWGVRDLVGNGWEWTTSDFAPFDGFRVWARTYPGYSADFFDGQHRVILGGSWATDPALTRPSFRNWFQMHYPYVFATFRTVRRGS